LEKLRTGALCRWRLREFNESQSTADDSWAESRGGAFEGEIPKEKFCTRERQRIRMSWKRQNKQKL